MNDFDVCIVGSGAGASPVAYTLAKAGFSVVVLEKGPWFTEQDFYKDELACCLRDVYTPSLKDEQHVIEDYDGKDKNGNYKWAAEATSESGWSFWNGNSVGGSSNFMSGYFYRLKPVDFRLRSEFGDIDGANVVDWPIQYDVLEPYYERVERLVGVSGHAVSHTFAEPRSTKDFPYPPTIEHPISGYFDTACKILDYQSLQTPRAILPFAVGNRGGCAYSGYCGSYGCSTGAKGSGRAALLDKAVATGKCKIIPYAKVYQLESNAKGKVTQANYFDRDNKKQKIAATVFVVACQAIETSRLLLASIGEKHPNGLANKYAQVGKNLLFSAGGSGTGEFYYDDLSPQQADEFKVRGPFINRGLQDWYVIKDKKFNAKMKGGTIDYLLSHPNPTTRADSMKWDDNDNLIWGEPLKQKVHAAFTEKQRFRFEVFNDWLPTNDCFVALDSSVKDKWGSAVAKVRVGYHDHDLVVGNYLVEKAETVLKQMNARNISSSVSGSPPANLVAGGCRFGNDPKTSVLNSDCQAHDADNLYVSDGSFMPTGGSVPYTWTIYANAFRVADIIKRRL
ncbi:Glucose-methanol-choline (GMC) oxidoreductase:NAD binding site [hydrothermal vent metagenome]|uniref:Glucose-methanol-choline (GMC) oxidoreductase:NAD binding site n=1 Tax=hydrothermal vent metagenome TaxID=652676 RepID=A0A3B0ZHV1_9ZZZZ